VDHLTSFRLNGARFQLLLGDLNDSASLTPLGRTLAYGQLFRPPRIW